MAERRMFAKTIIDSDAFLDMPLSAQALYFHLSMRADDDGFINNPKKIQRMVGASEDDLKLLIVKKFIIPFESGIVVIKHWKIHNYIQKDRYHATKYTEEKERLSVKENGAYTVMDTRCIQNVSNMDTEVRLGKDSIGNNTILSISDQTEHLKTKDLESEFEQIWKLYPHKEGKQKALQAYIKARKNGTDKDVIENGVKAYKAYVEAEKTEKRYIKHGSTWFNQQCWNDDYTISKPKNRFNDFEQREYTDAEFEELERRLFNQ